MTAQKKSLRIGRLVLDPETYEKFKAVSKKYVLDYTDIVKIVVVRSFKQNPDLF